MKKIHSSAASAAAIAAAMIAALASCTAKLDDVPSSAGGQREISVTAGSPDTCTGTKVSMDGQYRFCWESEGEQLAVSISCMQGGTYAFTDLGGKYITLTETDYLLSENAKEATFSFHEPTYPQGSGGFIYNFISPASAASFKGVSVNGRMTVSFPYEQHPVNEAPDPEAILLHAVHTSTNAPADGISTTFSHLNAFGKVTLKNLRLPEGETVEKICIDLPGEQCEGWSFDPEGTSSIGEVHNGRSIMLLLDRIDTSGISGSTGLDLWFGIMPQKVSEEDGFRVVVETGSGAIAKTVRPAGGVWFGAGKAAGFSIDMAIPDAAYGITLTVSAPAKDLKQEGIDGSNAFSYGIVSEAEVSAVHVMAVNSRDYENDPGICRNEIRKEQYALSASQLQAINGAGLNEIYTGLLPNTDYTLLVMARSGNFESFRTAGYSTSYEECDWKPIGSGSITDDFIGPLIGKSISTWSIHFDESITNPGLYRLLEPFGEDCPYYSDGSYDTGKQWYLLIDATDPDHVVVRRQAVGYCDGSRGMAELYNLPEHYMMQGETREQVISSHPECFARMHDGEIRFPAGSMLLKFGDASIRPTAMTDSDGDGWSDGCIELPKDGGGSDSGGEDEEEEF